MENIENHKQDSNIQKDNNTQLNNIPQSNNSEIKNPERILYEYEKISFPWSRLFVVLLLFMSFVIKLNIWGGQLIFEGGDGHWMFF